MAIRLLLLSLLLFAQPAEAARGFGATMGTGSTDSVNTGYTTTPTTTVSYSIWLWVNGNGGGNLGRIWDKLNSGTTIIDDFLYNSGTVVLNYQRAWTTGNGSWSIPRPSTGTWHHIVVTYNGGATTNDPVMYVDGVSQTVTEITPPSGTIQTNNHSYILGNRTSDNARNWDGKIAEFAMWSGVLLSQAEVTALYNGANPLLIRPTSLVLYNPLYGNTAGERDWGPSHLAQTVTGTAFQTHVRTQPLK